MDDQLEAELLLREAEEKVARARAKAQGKQQGITETAGTKLETPLERHQRLQKEQQQVRDSAERPPTFAMNALHPRARKIIEEATLAGEPIIVFRAKDLFTPMVLAHYLRLIEDILPTNFDQQADLVELRNEMVDWQRNNPGQIRYPD